MSLEEAQNYVEESFKEINAILDKQTIKFTNTKELINSLINRKW